MQAKGLRESELLPLSRCEDIFGFAVDTVRKLGERAEAASEAIDAVESASQTAAGIYATGESALGLLNTQGVLAYHAETLAQFSITALAGDSSGWTKRSSCYAGDLEPLGLALEAV